jgi:hypothetical protein
VDILGIPYLAVSFVMMITSTLKINIEAAMQSSKLTKAIQRKKKEEEVVALKSKNAIQAKTMTPPAFQLKTSSSKAGESNSYSTAPTQMRSEKEDVASGSANAQLQKVKPEDKEEAASGSASAQLKKGKPMEKEVGVSGSASAQLKKKKV